MAMMASVPGVSKRSRMSLLSVALAERGEDEADEQGEQVEAGELERQERARGVRAPCQPDGQREEAAPGRDGEREVGPGDVRAQEQREDDQAGGVGDDGASRALRAGH